MCSQDCPAEAEASPSGPALYQMAERPAQRQAFADGTGGAGEGSRGKKGTEEMIWDFIFYGAVIAAVIWLCRFVSFSPRGWDDFPDRNDYDH